MKPLHLFAGIATMIAVMGTAPVMAESTTVEDLLEDGPGVEAAAPEAPDARAGETEAFTSSETGEGDAVTAPVDAELPQPASASLNACTPEQSRQLRALGLEYALSLVRNDFLGGQGVEHLVQDCTFDGAIYEGILHVRWRGALMGWNEYSLWGRLRTYPDGANATFAPRGASESVQSLQFWSNVGTIGLSLVP